MKTGAWILTLFLSCAAPAIAGTFFHLSRGEEASVGRRIWQNECHGSLEGLVSWNAGEEFCSLGIGHFIWYPVGATNKRFQETFPTLVAYLKEKGVRMPRWLARATGAPWRTRDAFAKKSTRKRMQGLRSLLAATVVEQTEFILLNAETQLQRLVEASTPNEKSLLEKKLRRLSSTPAGTFALIDYLNFKGAGISQQECYQSCGWGLRQVLAGMSASAPHPLEAFISSAKQVLKRRIDLSPQERGESRWLEGWNNRLDSYLKEPRP